MPEIGQSLEQEIANLEQEIAKKKAALGQTETKPFNATQGKESGQSEKEILHSIVGEKIQQHIPQYTPVAPQPTHQVSDDKSLSYVLPELKEKVQELVNLVFNKSLEDGVKEVSKLNNPALIDAFHDVLVDELYNKLLERKKLEPVK